MTKQFSNYSDLITFTRASKGHALRPVSYGDEIINNGDFELGDNGDWGVSTNWTISGGVATLVGGDGVYGNSGLYQVIDLDVGKIYKVSLDVSGLTGTFRVYHASYSTGTNIDSTGTLVFNIVGESGGTRLNILGNNGSAVTLDNISVKEVTFDESDGTLTLFEHPDNVPRVEYDADGNRLGLLVEEARTNLFTYSEELSQKDQNMTTTDNAAIAPTGEQTASLCIPTNSNSEHYIDDAGVTSGVDYVISCFAKYGSGTYLLAFRGAGIGGNPPRFNLATGTIQNNSPSDKWSNLKMEAVGNGWYRCSAVATPNSTSPLRFQLVNSTGVASYVGDGTGHYLWGLQIEEAGLFPTSYIKTTGSTATRSSDVASIPVADFGYNQSAGAMLVQASTNAPLGSRTNDGIFSLEKNNNNLHRVYVSANDALNWQMRQGGSTVFATSIINNLPAEQEFKISLSWHSGSQDASYDGNAATNFGTATTMADTAVDLEIGYINTSNMLNGHIKSIKYYPRRLTNAQLQALTEPRSDATLSLTFDGLESSFTENYIHG